MNANNGVERPQGAGQPTEGRVVDMFAWRAERASRRWQDAQEHAGANPGSQDARDYARVAALEYTRAVMQRNATQAEARRKQTQADAQDLANRVKRGDGFVGGDRRW